MKFIIHVNRHHIASNAKDGGERPVYSIKQGGTIRYAREVSWNGPSKAIYDKKGLSCGAKAYIEVEGPITLIDEMSFKEAQSH